MKTFVTISIAMIFAYNAISQQAAPVITFEKTEHDFGIISEEMGKAVHRFEFTNSGATPLLINGVKSTCGCTTSDYTKQPVATGEKGYIEAVYHTSSRPGPFNKSIQVQTNDPAKPNISLTVKGNVTGKDKTVEQEFPRTIGQIRLQNNQISFINLKNSGSETREIPIMNSDKQPAMLEFENIPNYLTVEVNPNPVPAGEKATIKATADGTKINDIGTITDGRMSMKINGENIANNTIVVRTTVKEDFSQLTEKELAKAPKIKFTNTEHNFGTVKQGEKVVYAFTFKNEGKSPLVIRKVKTGCGCVITEQPNEDIKPGKNGTIKITFDSKGRKGKSTQHIDVYCNDPLTPEIKLKIEGNVDAENSKQ